MPFDRFLVPRFPHRPRRKVPRRSINLLAGMCLIAGIVYCLQFSSAAQQTADEQQQSSCGVNCSATVTASAQLGQPATFSAQATTTGCTGSPLYQWDFGDGTGANVQNPPAHIYSSAGVYNWKLTVRGIAPTSMALIDTVAGGQGENTIGLDISFAGLIAAANDPLGRGLYFVTAPHSNNAETGYLVKFLNTSNSDVIVGGSVIGPRRVRTVAGGGTSEADNVTGTDAFLGTVNGIEVSLNGSAVFMLSQTLQSIRVLNVSSATIPIAGKLVDSGKVSDYATPKDGQGVSLLGSNLSCLALNPTTGDLLFSDYSPAINRIYKITPTASFETVAGNSAPTQPGDIFNPGPATGIALLNPRAVEVDPSGNIIIADSGHGRVLRVTPAGIASLVGQFAVGRGEDGSFPAGLTKIGTSLFLANGNEQQVLRLNASQDAVAGQFRAYCNYVGTTCGDGGPALSASMSLPTVNSSLPGVAIEGDSTGIYILDQSPEERGRIRYVNLGTTSTMKAGVTIAPGAIATIAGNGRVWPYDGGLATSSTLKAPVGVAADTSGNLYILDSQNRRLRYVNRSDVPVTVFPGLPSEQNVPAGGIVTINYQGGVGATETAPVHLATFDYPQGIFVTGKGVFVVDTTIGPPPGPGGPKTSLLRFINTTSTTVTLFPGSVTPIPVPPGNVATIAGGSPDMGNGEFALKARFIGMSDVAVSSNGDIYVTDVGQSGVRKIDGNSGIVSSLAVPSSEYTGLGIAPDDRLLIVNTTAGSLIRQNSPGGNAFTTVTTGLQSPRDVAVDLEGVAYVTSAGLHRVLGVTPTGVTSVIAGTTQGFAGDGGAATSAKLNISPALVSVAPGPANRFPQTVGIIVTPLREIYFTDTNNNRIRRVGPEITTCTRTGTVIISNPAPALTSINPTSAPRESASFTLTVRGSNFVNGSVVRWNGNARQTMFVSANELKATIPPEDLLSAGSAEVLVFTPSPGGGTSNAAMFIVTNPVPTVTSLAPSSRSLGGGAFQLTVNGSNFIQGSTVNWDGQPRATQVLSPTQVRADIPETDLNISRMVNVTVVNPSPGGGASGALQFSITNPQPAINGLIPLMATAGGDGFLLTVTGTSFVPTSSVTFNGVGKQTSFVSSTQLVANLSTADVAAGGEIPITVTTPGPGGGTSNQLTFVVNNPAPAMTSIEPSIAAAGSLAFNLTVKGSNFVVQSKVRWNGSERPTTYVNPTTLTAVIPATDIIQPAQVGISVFNRDPGGGVSGTLSFTVAGMLTTVSAASFKLGPVAPGGIVAGFGSNLATADKINEMLPLPTVLEGTHIEITDSAASVHSAGLFGVFKSQVNYLIPTNISPGAASVKLTSGDGTISFGTLMVAPYAPGIFTATADGKGPAAGNFLRVTATNEQTYEDTAIFSASSQTYVARCVDLGPSSELIFIVLYGTGIRGVPSPSLITATIGDLPIPVLAAQPQGTYVGVDQINLGPIPRSLIGRGIVRIRLAVDGAAMNEVEVCVK